MINIQLEVTKYQDYYIIYMNNNGFSDWWKICC